MANQSGRTNRLIQESSPYLRQHATNPVDWYPWGEEALAKAKAENKPIFLSIGYSACHWCHVMERESFVDSGVAQVLNAEFVPVKVDREERPDLDQSYQEAVQIMTGQGGWPLSVFLTPTGEPFYGGTYFPPQRSYGRPGFLELLQAVATAWRERPAETAETGRRLAEAFAEPRTAAGAMEDPGALVEMAVADMARAVDRQNGGFGRAPKFPNVSGLRLLMSHGRLADRHEMVDSALLSLRRMARGGIHDQLGGGFHRYATDDRWLVPHFEKMLYDNGLLLTAYTEAYQLTKEEEFAAAARGIATYIDREMTAPAGGFYASQDADSAGGEGRFYTWTREEMREVLADEDLVRIAAAYFGFDGPPQMQGRYVPHLPAPAVEIAEKLGISQAELDAAVDCARRLLFTAREQRDKPARDDKIILGWNGLMISGLARAGQALRAADALESARRAAAFILREMRMDTGRFLRVYHDGRAKIPAFLDDYAYFIAGLIDLYESDFTADWLRMAVSFTETVSAEFKIEDGRYALAGRDTEKLFARPVSGPDQAVPSGVAVHCRNLLRLGAMAGREDFIAEAGSILNAYGTDMRNYPMNYAGLIDALEMSARGPTLIVAVGHERNGETMSRLRQAYIPLRVMAGRRGEEETVGHPAAPILADRPVLAGEPTFYVCSEGSCYPPKTRWEEMEEILS